MENLKYFLAANSCEGFVSSFNDCFDISDGWHAYIIKGGPGTGKSSFMKYVASKTAEKGYITELCPCSSDPDSLDAVVIPQKKAVILDGTAPHIVEPVYPGICEEILNFGEFWNTKQLKSNTVQIKRLTDTNKALHQAAARYMQAAGKLLTENLKLADANTDKAKALSYAKTLCRNYIPPKKGIGKEWIRYLCGITPRGIVSYSKTALATEKQVIIKDEYGSASNIIMQAIRSYALSAGYEVITVKNAFLPSQLTDHIIIPELSLSFLREYDFASFSTETRRVHSRRFVSMKNLNKSRERMRFNKKAINELLLSAVGILREAKTVHDELEKYYVESMDFTALTEYAKSFTEKLLS